MLIILGIHSKLCGLRCWKKNMGSNIEWSLQAHFLFFLLFSLLSAWGVQGCMRINNVYITFSFWYREWGESLIVDFPEALRWLLEMDKILCFDMSCG